MTKLFSRSDYDTAFARERSNEYPAIHAFEKQMGYAISRTRLENAARTLACPVKANPPNWQHGRLIYASARRLLTRLEGEEPLMLDIGTAKGFSALCTAFALADHSVRGSVVSVDVVDPAEAVARNSVAELDGPLTVPQFLASWPEAKAIWLRKAKGVEWLRAGAGRIHFAFVDGKHSQAAVREEAALLAARQKPGDVTIFDDLQVAGVHRAVVSSAGDYDIQFIEAKPERRYAIATRT